MNKFLLLLALALSSLFAQNSNDDMMKILENRQTDVSYDAFLELAKSGDLDAQTLLGEMYLDGIGVETDYEKAFFWLSKAAHRDDAQAQYLLGLMYEKGLHVTQDVKHAVKWYKKSALQGDVLAQYNLALIYKEGKGTVGKNIQEAFKWLKMVEYKENQITRVATNKMVVTGSQKMLPVN